MGTHLIPREPDGESRILIIFTPKGFLGMLIGLIPGILLHSIFSICGATIVAWVMLIACGVIGLVIGQAKMPESRAFDLMRKTGGEYIRDIIKNYLKFNKKRKYYLYDIEAATSNSDKNN